jgi:hypothetical protein
MVLLEDQDPALLLQHSFLLQVFTSALDGFGYRRHRDRAGPRSGVDDKTILGVLAGGFGPFSLAVQHRTVVLAVVPSRDKGIEDRKAKHREKGLDGSEVVSDLRKHRLWNVGLGGRLCVLEAKPLGLLGLPDAIVFEPSGVSLRKASRLRGDGNRRRPELLSAMVLLNPVEAVFCFSHVSRGLAGIVSDVAEQEVHPDALNLSARFCLLKLLAGDLDGLHRAARDLGDA